MIYFLFPHLVPTCLLANVTLVRIRKSFLLISRRLKHVSCLAVCNKKKMELQAPMRRSWKRSNSTITISSGISFFLFFFFFGVQARIGHNVKAVQQKHGSTDDTRPVIIAMFCSWPVNHTVNIGTRFSC